MRPLAPELPLSGMLVVPVSGPTTAWLPLLYPVTTHGPPSGSLAAGAAASLGLDAVVPTEQSAGGDDFAWYAELVPSTYVRLGVHDPLAELGFCKHIGVGRSIAQWWRWARNRPVD